MTKLRLFTEWFMLLFLACVLVVLANNRGWTERLDLNLLDFASSLMAVEGNPDIVIVEIDDKSLAAVGNWPWDRARHGDLIAELAALEPSVIAVDILFLEQSDPAADSALAKAVAEAGNVVLPHTFIERSDGVSGTIPAMPIVPLANAAASLGHVAISPDRDGLVRRFAPIYQSNKKQYDHAILSMIHMAGREVDISNGSGFVGNGDALPMIQYGLPGKYRTASAADVIDGAVPRAFFKDKFVLIGATAQGLGDRYAVPTYAGRIMSGVELQANALASLIAQDTIMPLNQWIVLGLHLIAISSLFLVYWLRPPAEALRYSLLLIAALVVAAFASVILLDVWLPVAPALAAILIAYPLWGWRRLATVSRFLDREVKALRASGLKDDLENSDNKGKNSTSFDFFGQSSAGFDVVQRQVASLRGLTGEVRERLSFIQDVVDASPDPMLVFDGEGRLALFNVRAKQIFLYGTQERELTLNELVASLGGDIDPAAQEVNLPDGRTFLLASAPLDAGLGSEIVALRDITEIKEGEQQRRETLEFLSHDMRSPQVAIIGLAEKAGGPMELKERFDRIAEQARRTLTLAENFVQIARLENEGIRAEDTEMGALVHEAADRAYSIAKRKGIRINCNVPEEPIFCEVDASAISRVVDNLLSNALKFSPDASRIHINLSEAANDRLSLILEDEGPGMPAERQKQPFARFGAHDSKAGPSAGLGLAYVKRAIDEHGGAIAVLSAANKGTRIEIELPVAQVMSEAAE
jgi:CHASE2 domain-containing sensor protein/nitrogen-specific signal transduction histidine kinase